MIRVKGRARRHLRIRKKVFGTQDRPRLVIYRSLKNLYAQIVDDISHKTIISVSTNTPDMKSQINYGGNVKAAASLGAVLAKKAADKGIKNVVFDRSGYIYHGRIRALAEAALKNGLSFRKEEGVSKIDGKKDGRKG